MDYEVKSTVPKEMPMTILTTAETASDVFTPDFSQKKPIPYTPLKMDLKHFISFAQVGKM